MYLRCIAFICCLFLVSGCALGKKEWPSADKGEDTFTLSVINGQRSEGCLVVNVQVKGAVDRLAYVNVQFEPVGNEPGQGCPDCPFMPRRTMRFSRGDPGFDLEGNRLRISYCGLKPAMEYRFRIIGVNDLNTTAYTYTDIFVASP
ncbi:hypothetical protein [Pseudodesulfovibrio senegalensis]|jgi:hypothetical protein|uniref:Uncharacterized protein n=1 Tax=Pseudodesulfovibrio senegalensis TaxID=1721087 RepID=A0A6N6N729_9BACT|nr:hypothetical protein [Pseudodesulfovibrio senegalensis]KAB1443816.1 hypothetical protein F8A88_06170 [Pseudodesulfovibrio senegalensis]